LIRLYTISHRIAIFISPLKVLYMLIGKIEPLGNRFHQDAIWQGEQPIFHLLGKVPGLLSHSSSLLSHSFISTASCILSTPYTLFASARACSKFASTSFSLCVTFSWEKSCRPKRNRPSCSTWSTLSKFLGLGKKVLPM